jgi:hypothetical protein
VPLSTTGFADALYAFLNLDNIVGSEEWENLIPDPLFKLGIADWTCDPTYTIVQSQDQNIYGTSSIKAQKTGTGPANDALISPVMTLQGGIEYAASVYVYIPSAYTGSYVRITEDASFAGATINNAYAQANMAMRNQWQRIWISIVPAIGDTAGTPVVVQLDPTIPVAASSTIYVGAPQLEVGSQPNAFSDNSSLAPAKVITKNFLDAIGAAFEQMDALVFPNGQSQWSTLLDLDLIPDEGLPWFGQFTGTLLNPGQDDTEQRNQIRNNNGWRRGTVDSIIYAVRPLLTGTQTVHITERDTSAYHFQVVTYTVETPDSNLVNLAIIEAKPAGLQFTYNVIAGTPTAATYEALYLDDPFYSDVYAEEQTYQDVYTNP